MLPPQQATEEKRVLATIDCWKISRILLHTYVGHSLRLCSDLPGGGNFVVLCLYLTINNDDV